ncbi:MAG TPA: outer membrane lipoprotein-sorting protein [Albitalea sp.]|nr:outer membrane lipoprotein-sorting protein [Albitalea sp.]
MVKPRARWHWALPLLAMSLPARSAPTAAELMEQFDRLLWGRTLQGQFEMVITTPSWSRSLSMELWSQRPARSFVRISAPARDAGILSLRVGSEMWNYLPGIERTVKIPPSMMLQPWLGSDFTNDDMVKESSIVGDYVHRIAGERVEDGVEVVEIESLPKPDAAVVWGRLLTVVRKADGVPLNERFFDERGRLVRTLTYSMVRELGGRAIPTRWEMRPEGQPGKSTTIVVKQASYDAPIAGEVFSLQNLSRRH